MRESRRLGKGNIDEGQCGGFEITSTMMASSTMI